MRSRNIKAGFFRDAEMLEFPLEARFLFIGLWCLADREGKLEDKPRQIKVEVFGERIECDCDQLLNLLVERNRIIRYSIDNSQYIKIINFSKHQSPHHTEAQSKIPDPPDLHGELTVSHGESPAPSPLDSLNPDSLKRERSAKPTSTDGKAARPSFFSVNDLVKLWNELADAVFPKVRLPLADSRARAVQAALKSQPDRAWWVELFNRVNGSPFLKGQTDGKWRANFDWVIKKRDQIMEGTYDPLAGANAPPSKCLICGGSGYIKDSETEKFYECQCRKKEAVNN